jgi:tripartite-type tricarboxylate transporter receptor subunit TctC
MTKAMKKGFLAATALVLSLAVAVPPSAAQDWPKEPLRIMIPSAAGGGTDVIARGLQQFLSKELGVPISAQNMAGANHALAARAVAKASGDCQSILAIYEPSLVTMAISESGLDFTYADFYPLGGIIVEPFALFVPNNSRFKDWDSLWQEIVKNPGKVRVGVTSWYDITTVHLLEMEEQLGVKFNIVRYDGGSKARAALLAGETDFGYHILFGSQGVWDETRTLAYFNASQLKPKGDISKLVDNAPPLQSLTKAKLTDTVLTFSLYVSAKCRKENPARYNKLVDALRKIMDNPEYQAQLDKLHMRQGLLGVMGDDFYAVYKDMRPDLEAKIKRLVLPRMAK